jgi:RNA polymerase sigma-70 factor (ECF subfamily)
MRRKAVEQGAVVLDVVGERSLAIEAFIASDYRRIVGSIALITGNRATAEDAVQDALAKAWQRRDQPIERLAAWVTVVASNAARSSVRRRGAEQRALDRLGGRAHSSPDEAADDPQLQQALAGLPLRERQVAVLHYVLDQSVADTAAAMGVTDGTVKTLLSRARQHLATQLGMESKGGVA